MPKVESARGMCIFKIALLSDWSWVVSSDRFDEVSLPCGGGLSRGVGETIAVTTLQPVFLEDADSRGASADWLVHAGKQVTSTSDTAMVVFGFKFTNK